MHVDIVHLPAELSSIDLSRRVAVVFDVLRATTTMTTALANGAREIRAFGTLDEAAAASAAFNGGPKLLAGERKTLRPDGFDLGNSPEDFTPDRVAGRTIILATTNGTVAVRACGGARRTFVAGLCNATAMARLLASSNDDVVMVCAGTEGVAGLDDISGGATVADVLGQLRSDVTLSERLRADIGAAARPDDPRPSCARCCTPRRAVGTSIAPGCRRMSTSPRSLTGSTRSAWLNIRPTVRSSGGLER